MAVMKAPKVPGWLLKGFAIAPRLTRRLVTAYLLRRPPDWLAHYRAAASQSLDCLGLAQPERVAQVGQLPMRFVADVMFLRHAPLAALRRLPLRLFGAEHAVPVDGQGTVFACSNFGCFYANFLAPPPGITEVLVVTPNVPPEEDRALCRRIEAVSGVKLTLVAASTKSAIAIARTLRKGGAVATMLDSWLSNTPMIVAPFLGHPAATPRGLYEILARTPARIVPVYGLRRGEGFDITYQRPICAMGQTPEALATAVNARLEELVREHPEQWALWPALPGRWKAAADATLAARVMANRADEPAAA